MSDVFPGALLRALEENPHVPAFEYGDRVVSRAELADAIARFASALRDAGARPGTGIAIASGVTPEGFAVQIAAHTLGCRVVGIRPGLTQAQLTVVLDDIDIAVTDTTVTPTTETTLGAVVPTVLRLGELSGSTEPLTTHENTDDIALVVYTSGSTGTPKGVEFTYGALTAHWSWQHPQPEHVLTDRYQRFLLFGTLTSAVILEHLALCLTTGGTAVIPQGAPDFPDVLADLRITACLLTVPRLNHLLDECQKRDIDLSAARALLVAGSPLPPHRLHEAHQLLGDAILQGYGQTETGMLTLLTESDIRQRPDTLHSVGSPWADAEIDVRDDNGTSLPPDTTGEIFIRRTSVFAGYRGDPEETTDVLTDGWVRTRDLGHLDLHGHLFLTGRARDIIIVNAIIHYAGPIERVLTTHPHVDQAYVIGEPDERTGEAIHAFITPTTPETRPDPAELHALVANQLGDAAIPQTVTMIDTIPTTPNGKPDKQALRTPHPHTHP